MSVGVRELREVIKSAMKCCSDMLLLLACGSAILVGHCCHAVGLLLTDVDEPPPNKPNLFDILESKFCHTEVAAAACFALSPVAVVC